MALSGWVGGGGVFQQGGLFYFCVETAQIASLAFRHLRRRIHVVNVCLEFDSRAGFPAPFQEDVVNQCLDFDSRPRFSDTSFCLEGRIMS